MSKHLVLGAGNLGFDLVRSLTNAGHDAICYSRNNTRHCFSYPISPVSHLKEIEPEYIWCTIGAGSVDAAKSNFIPFIDLHARLTSDLIQQFGDKAKIIFFSTDYAASEKYPSDPLRTCIPRSAYAMSKLWMEQLVDSSRNPNIKAIRVCSLYGAFKKEETFPARILARYPKAQKVYFPSNLVTPSPTWWVADTLVKNLDAIFDIDIPILHCAPAGSISVSNWASCILGGEYEVISHGLDIMRPPVSALGCSLMDKPPQWNVLWNDSRNPFFKAERCIV